MEITKAEIASVATAPSSASTAATPSPASGHLPELRGAEILVKTLQAEGVKYIWGYPGGAA
jgi:acetolactate synthase I/II/III large subunit